MRAIVGVLLLVLSTDGLALTPELAESRFDPKLYLGLEAQKLHMSFQEGCGDNLLYHTFSQGNIYVGYRFDKHFAFEFGYEESITRARERTLTTGDIAAGMLIPAVISPVVFRSKINMKGHHISLVGFYPLCTYKDIPVEVFGSIGVAFLKGTAERHCLSVAGFPIGNVTFQPRTLVGRKTALRAALGLQLQFHERLSVRTTVGWVNTSRVILNSNDGIFGMYLPQIKPKNTLFFGLGLVWNFC